MPYRGGPDVVLDDRLEQLNSSIAIVMRYGLCYGNENSKSVHALPYRGVSSMKRGEKEPVQVRCPQCGSRSIVYLPVDDLPRCSNPECSGARMVIEELLDEGKSY